MDAANKPAEIVVVRAATEEEEAKCVISPKQDAAMSQDNLPLPMALRATELSEREFDGLRRHAKDTNATTGRLKRVPHGIASRELEAVAS
jgi:hypothetical protein